MTQSSSIWNYVDDKFYSTHNEIRDLYDRVNELSTHMMIIDQFVQELKETVREIKEVIEKKDAPKRKASVKKEHSNA